MQTPEHFRSLASTLIARRTPADDEPAFSIVEDAIDPVIEEVLDGGEADESDDAADLLRDVRLFHARIIEAVESAVETLAGDIAADVLGRELLLAPADVEAIVDRALQRYAAEHPLRVRVHESDAAMACAVPLVVDARLRPGDAVIELSNGTVDASLGMRLATLMRGLHA